MNNQAALRPIEPVQVLAVASGRNGAGNTSVAVNLATALANRGAQVMLLDGANGAGLSTALGLHPERDLGHVLRGEAGLEEILLAGPPGVTVVPSGSRDSAIAGLNLAQSAAVISAFSDLAHPPEILVVDTAASANVGTQSLVEAAGDALVLIGNETGGLMAAARLIAELRSTCSRQRIRVCANRVADDDAGQALFERLDRYCEPLGMALHYVGAIPYDAAVNEAREHRTPVVNDQPSSRAARAFKQLARRTETWAPPPRYQGGIAFFVERLICSDQLLHLRS